MEYRGTPSEYRVPGLGNRLPRYGQKGGQNGHISNRLPGSVFRWGFRYCLVLPYRLNTGIIPGGNRLRNRSIAQTARRGVLIPAEYRGDFSRYGGIEWFSAPQPGAVWEGGPYRSMKKGLNHCKNQSFENRRDCRYCAGIVPYGKTGQP